MAHRHQLSSQLETLLFAEINMICEKNVRKERAVLSEDSAIKIARLFAQYEVNLIVLKKTQGDANGIVKCEKKGNTYQWKSHEMDQNCPNYRFMADNYYGQYIRKMEVANGLPFEINHPTFPSDKDCVLTHLYTTQSNASIVAKIHHKKGSPQSFDSNSKRPFSFSPTGLDLPHSPDGSSVGSPQKKARTAAPEPPTYEEVEELMTLMANNNTINLFKKAKGVFEAHAKAPIQENHDKLDDVAVYLLKATVDKDPNKAHSHQFLSQKLEPIMLHFNQATKTLETPGARYFNGRLVWMPAGSIPPRIEDIPNEEKAKVCKYWLPKENYEELDPKEVDMVLALWHSFEMKSGRHKKGQLKNPPDNQQQGHPQLAAATTGSATQPAKTSPTETATGQTTTQQPGQYQPNQQGSQVQQP